MASAQVNGYRSAVAEQAVQSAFYDQWLQLRETVLADKHAHFKLPAAVRQRLQPQTGPSSAASYASASQLPGLFNASSSEQAMHNPSLGPAAAARLGNAQAFLQNTSAATGTTATKSGIDPVLLTKSEDLIRAEMQLKRQRIERQLKDTADQRRHIPFFKNQEDMAPLIGLTETFEKALELVKPVSGLKPPANTQTAANDSFDENSYYSSQANDWSSEEGSPKKKAATGPASSAPLSKQHPVGIELHDKQHQSIQTFEHLDTEALYDAEREDSEEYSPPDANAFSGPDADADAMDLDDGKWHIQCPYVTQLSEAQTAASSCLRKLMFPRPKHPSSPVTSASSLPPNPLESRLLPSSNLLDSTRPRQAIPQRLSVSCLLRHMPTNRPAPSANSSSPTIRLLRLAIPLRPVQPVLSRNKEERARRGSERLTGKREKLAKADPSLALHRLSRISNPNLYHHRRSLHLPLCNPHVPAHTSCRQMLR